MLAVKKKEEVFEAHWVMDAFDARGVFWILFWEKNKFVFPPLPGPLETGWKQILFAYACV